MKLTIGVSVTLGQSHERKVEEGIRTVQNVYERTGYRFLGSIRKGAKGSVVSGRNTWIAYTRTGRQIGVYTLRDYAIEQVVRSAFDPS